MHKKNLLKHERVAFILEELQRRYPSPPIPLDHKDPYTLLVAVLLSAQCTDARVNSVTPALWQLADNCFDMAKQSQVAIQTIIRPCGLSPQKSKAIKNLSQILVDRYHGEIPRDIEALETLPGVGHKTASVVMAQAFGEATFPVDTHIHRLAQRWGLSSGKNVKQTEKDLKRLFPKQSWNQLHLQIIYYAREHCSARGCDGTVCYICSHCYPKRNKALATKSA